MISIDEIPGSTAALAICVYYVVAAMLSVALAPWTRRHAPAMVGLVGIVYAALGPTGVVEMPARRRALARDTLA